MSATEVELCLARLYTNAQARRAFLADPLSVLGAFDLDASERDAFVNIDRAGLTLAANSFSAKRAKYKRWMHMQVKQVPQYEALVPAAILTEIRALVHRRAARQLGQQGDFPRLQRRLDFIQFQADSHHNREHMLYETQGLQPLVTTWESLQAAVLLNHHLLRCYAVTTDAPQMQEVHREHPRPSTYLTCIAVDDGADAAATDHLVLFDERQEVVGRYPMQAGCCVVLPADVLHRIERAGAEGVAGRLLLVFKSLAAIQ